MTKPLPTATVFVFEPPVFDAENGTARLPYRFDTGPAFVERFDFGRPSTPVPADRLAVVHRLLAYLHAVAGVSYYKGLIPPRLDVAATGLDEAATAFVRELYRHGLGEFAYRNGLELDTRLQFTGARGRLEPLRARLPERALVPIGGGKDSLVTVELLRSAGAEQVLFAVNPKGPIVASIEASGFDALTVKRRLDPALFELNARGALNGHVPITAIISLAALVTAAWHGFDRVVMSNERSADVGNLEIDGFDVNHQWSKSSTFETALRAELARAVSPDLDWFSLLRPLSELAIAKRFAAVERYDHVFSSCNRNFHIDREGPERRWCRNCPKCRFVFLALAPFIGRDRLLQIFGGNLLDDPAQIDGFRELAGFDGHKPFECVGETGEAAAAFAAIAERSEWREHTVLRALEPDLAPRSEALRVHFDSALEVSDDGFVPTDLRWVLQR